MISFKYDVKIKAGNLTRGGQTSGIKRLMIVNLLKRLESSVEAFRLTMNGMLRLNKAELRRLEMFNAGKIRPDAQAIKKVFTDL